MNKKAIVLAIIIFALIVGSLFSWSAYSYYEAIHADDPIRPFAYVDVGSATIIRGDTAYDLAIDERFDLENLDIIETPRGGIVSITWPDRSMTRVGEKSRIVIREMLADREYDNIKISYNMERGKVWNTIIRSLVGDSYFEVTLPREGVVAGVRGTVFEINLDQKYIQAVDHATTLSDMKGNVHLLPGELVSTENIWIKKGREWIDTTWNDWNTTADQAYESLRSLEIERRLSVITGSGKSMVEGVSRSILSSFSGFEDLDIAEKIRSGDIDGLRDYSTEKLLSYYQRIPDIRYAGDRAQIRDIILQNASNAKLRESLDMHALWDSLDTGNLTNGVSSYLESKGINITEFRGKFIEGAKNDTKKLLENFSGSLQGMFGF